jgi:hypothetical protein
MHQDQTLVHLFPTLLPVAVARVEAKVPYAAVPGEQGSPIDSQGRLVLDLVEQSGSHPATLPVR